MKELRKDDPFDDWMNDFELPQTNEWQKKKYYHIQPRLMKIVF